MPSSPGGAGLVALAVACLQRLADTDRFDSKLAFVGGFAVLESAGCPLVLLIAPTALQPLA